MKSLVNKNILILGLGISGKACVKILKKNNKLILVDDKLYGKKFFNIDIFSSKQIIKSINKKNIDLIILSPGINPDHIIIKKAKKEKIQCISEIEAAYRINNENFIIGITGTNGKTTVTNYIYEILKYNNKKTFKAGNIGYPLIEIQAKEKNAFIAAELSSFQLKFTKKFKTNIGIILNIDYDHLNWHKNFSDYFKSKLKLIKKNNFIIYNLDDKKLNRYFKTIKNKNCFSFSLTSKKADLYFYDNSIFYKKEKILNIKPKKYSLTSLLNLLPAILCYLLIDKEKRNLNKIVNKLLKEKKEHRLETFKIKNHIIINDSKSTNPHSVENAIEDVRSRYNKLDKTIILIGGQNKNLNFSHLKDKLKKFNKVIFFGAAAEEISSSMKLNNSKKIKTLKETIKNLPLLLNRKNIILLSPGCASFDEFKNYKHRGEYFKKNINKILK